MVFLLVNFITCTTKDGIEFEEGKGSLWVTSENADSACIFLDYRDTGKRTPALLESLTPGQHVVHLFRSTFRTSPDSQLVEVEENTADTATFILNSSPHGNLNIGSSPDSARVFINKLEFGLTPDTVRGLPVGIYYLQLLKGNFDTVLDTVEILANDELTLNYQLQEDIRRFVLLDHFSNTSCPPCPQSDAIIDYLARRYGPAQLVVLGYHANFPSPNDPMYLSAKDANDSRINFYKPPSIPRAFVDGMQVSNPLDSLSYINLIDGQILSDTLLTISFLQLNRLNDLISGRLEIKSLSNMSSDHRLYIALIEDEIDYPSPPGTNGQTHFEAVLRDFYPDGSGTPINLLSQQTTQYNFSFVLDTEWGDDLTVIAFIQNSVNKSVLQSGWTRYPPF
jgi:thiol-disulfide isomerase/thioredoxin